MRSFKTFLAEQRSGMGGSANRGKNPSGVRFPIAGQQFKGQTPRGTAAGAVDRPQAQLQAPGSGQMPRELGAGGTGGGSPAPRAVRRPFETIRRGLNFPFNLISRGGGKRTLAKVGTAGAVANFGIEDARNTLQNDVNEYLSQSGYADVQLNRDQSLKAWRDLSTKDQTALAGSLNAFRDYYGPAALTAGGAALLGNPLVAAVPTAIDRATSLATGTESKPMLDARRAVAGQLMRPFPATSVFSGENPSAARAGYNFISNVEDMAKGIRTRQQGIRQNVLYPGRGPESEPAQTGITVDLDSTSTRRTPRTNR